MHYCGLCLIVKDENEYLKEWVEYHLHLGVDHILIYDNESQIPVTQTLADPEDTGRISIFQVSGSGYGRQVVIYGRCLREHSHDYKWLGFIDADEFIVPTTGQNLPEILSEYEDFGGLAIPWLMYGSASHLTPPPEGVLAGYPLRSREKFEANRHIKSIVQCDRAAPINAITPHHFTYNGTNHCVDENRRIVRGPDIKEGRTYDKIRLNHYFTRSRVDWLGKMKRGSAMGNYRRPEEFTAYERDCNIVNDPVAVRIRNAMRWRQDHAMASLEFPKLEDGRPSANDTGSRWLATNLAPQPEA